MSSKYDPWNDTMKNTENTKDEANASKLEDLGPFEYPADQHRLEYPYWLWYSKRTTKGKKSQRMEEYSQTLQLVAQFGTVEQWWSIYSHTVRLNEMAPYTNLHLFKHGIRPLWEDPANENGGKWVIRFRKGQIGRAWENLCMAMLGEQFMVGDEICGIIASIRYQEDVLSLWNKTSSDHLCIVRIKETLRRILNLPLGIIMEYNVHDDSRKLADTNSSTSTAMSSEN